MKPALALMTLGGATNSVIRMGLVALSALSGTVGNAMVSTAQFEYQGWVATFFMIVGAAIAAKATIRPRSAAGTPVPAGSRTA